MNPGFARLTRWAGTALALAVMASAPVPAAADNFSFGYSSGFGHHRHHHYPYWWGPRVVYAPPPVIVVPQPSVVYGPPAPIYYQAPYQAPLSAAPTSQPYRAADGRLCREYQTTINVGGVMQPSYGTACQQPDGTWRIVN